jgi:hypothetical protein
MWGAQESELRQNIFVSFVKEEMENEIYDHFQTSDSFLEQPSLDSG